MILERKKYDNFIELPKVVVDFNKRFRKTVLKLNKNENKILNISLISYIPNQKYINKVENIKLSKTTSKKYTKIINNSFSIHFLTLDKLINIIYNIDGIDTKIGILTEFFCEQKSNDIDFYIQKSLCFFEELYDDFFPTIIELVESNFINFCYPKYLWFKDMPINSAYKLFSDLYKNYFSEISYLLSKFNVIFDDTFTYSASFSQINIPTQTVLIKKRYIQENYENTDKYYSKIEKSTEIFYIKTIKELFNTIMYIFISNNIPIRKCRNCKRYFIASRRDAIYCHLPSPQNIKRSCNQYRNHFSKRQIEQNKIITDLYDKFYTLCSNNMKKNIEYKKIWEYFKQEYLQKQDDIIYKRISRTEMINWLNKILKNPYLLLEKDIDFNKLMDEIAELNKLENPYKNS